MKKVVTEKEDEFLYPGDVWSGFLGRDYQNKVEDFLRKGVWCINEKNKTYQTFHDGKKEWTDMDWLGDKLAHEVECAKHLGKRLDYGEMLETLKRLGNK